ncbi:MAG: hypothetical protein GXY86_12130, partial [Firmicutes bacterium]|nr:hypothetical protein [Bacillota bacterium]
RLVGMVEQVVGIIEQSEGMAEQVVGIIERLVGMAEQVVGMEIVQKAPANLKRNGGAL